MLYEVITMWSISPIITSPQVRKMPNAYGSNFPQAGKVCHSCISNFPQLGKTCQDFISNFPQARRITSYNVCYTKLLRGMFSTWVPVMVIVAGIIASYGFAGGFTDFPSGVYGIGFAAVGMLSTLGITLATDAFA